MKLTTKGRFAVTALLDIAIRSEKNTKPISLSGISERQKISLSHLEQIFVKLRQANIVASHKGPGGGYTLARELGKISIAEIINSVHEDMDARSCRGGNDCKEKQRCLTHDLWADLTLEINNYLSKISLKDVLAKSNQPEVIKIVR